MMPVIGHSLPTAASCKRGGKRARVKKGVICLYNPRARVCTDADVTTSQRLIAEERTIA